MFKQQGVVLIVSLVILLVVTLLGTAAMQGTGLEFKMAQNTSERQRVFQATEAGLRRMEQNIQDTPYSESDLDSSTCASGTSTCFEDTCAGGLCFFGDNAGPTQQHCDPVTTPPADPVWFDTALDVWNTNTKNQAVTIDTVNVKAIIEFRCFVDTENGEVTADSGDPSYRITTLGTSASGRMQVMLQSTYSVPAS